MVRRLAVSLALIASLALTGCVKIESEAPTQEGLIGDVDLVTTMCLSSSAGSCPASGSNRNNAVDEDGGAWQLLVAYRVPTNVTAPATISATYKAPQTGTVDLSASPSYTSELQAKAAPPAGQKWVGYLSRGIAHGDRVPDAHVELRAKFKLERGADGAPFAGPFRFLTVAGERPDRTTDVICANDVTNGNNDVFCVDTPKGTETAVLAGGTDFPVRDLGVLQPVPVAVEQGKTATVPFTVRGSNMDGTPSFDLAASTTAPGASVSGPPAFTLFGSGDTTVPVYVSVPASTPPGTYSVTLGARRGADERFGRGQLTVVEATPVQAPPQQPVAPQQPQPEQPTTPQDRTPATVGLALGSKLKLAKALKSGVPLLVTCSEACSGEIVLGSKTKPLGSGRGSRASVGSFTVTAKFTRAARKRYAKAKKLKLKVLLDVTDSAGNATAKTVTLSLKR